MAEKIPTIKELEEIAKNSFKLHMGIDGDIPDLSFLGAISKVMAVLGSIYMKSATFLAEQKFISRASYKEVYINGKKTSPLIMHGLQSGVGIPKPPTRAELRIEADVLSPYGKLEAGTLLIRASTRVIYSVMYSVNVDASTIQTIIQSVDDDRKLLGMGPHANLQVGDILTFANPPAFISREARVIEVISIAAAPETEESYRRRVLKRSQMKPQGGALIDYQIWGEATIGVKSVYPYRGRPGWVKLFVEATITPENPDGIADKNLLDAVEYSVTYDIFGKQGRKPATATVTLASIRRTEISVQVAGLNLPDGTDDSIVKEKIADYVDPPRFIPTIGMASLHHAHYKCTIYFSERTINGWPVPYTLEDKEAAEVIYVDHNHFHMCGNPDTGTSSVY